MYKTVNTSRQRRCFPFLLAAALIMAACSPKGPDGQKPLSIEDTVVSKTGSPKDKLAVEQLLTEKTAETKKLSAAFAQSLKGEIALDQKNMVRFNSMTVPSLTLNGQSLVNDLTYTDKISMATPGAVATIFVKSGREFVRIATSLKKQSGLNAPTLEEVAVGSTLSHKSPAYGACLAGNAYTGTAKLFGSTYMTEYTPIKNASGTVIGARFVGIDISSDLVLLKRKLGT
jgi:hypothetical protein